jgi:hypothetical protein
MHRHFPANPDYRSAGATVCETIRVQRKHIGPHRSAFLKARYTNALTAAYRETYFYLSIEKANPFYGIQRTAGDLFVLFLFGTTM